MGLGISFELKCSQPRSQLLAQLTDALAPVPKLLSIKPIKLGDLLGPYQGKSFVGELKGERFKMVLLGNVNRGVRWHGGGVIIAGQIGEKAVHADLRPPLFTVVFILFWVLIVTGAFVLSFFGPSNTTIVRALLFAMLILPPAILSAMFAFEAGQAKRRLRDVFCV